MHVLTHKHLIIVFPKDISSRMLQPVKHLLITDIAVEVNIFYPRTEYWQK